VSHHFPGIARLLRWFHGRHVAGASRRSGKLSLELDGVLRIACVEDDRIEASIVSRIRRGTVRRAPRCTRDDDPRRWPVGDPDPTHGETQVDIRCRSSAALAQAEPFVWLQLVDDGGTPVTQQMLLGRGVGNQYEFHAQFDVPSRTPSTASARPTSGLHARVMTRTFRNECGPQYHMEVLTLTLLKAGDPSLDAVRPAPLPLPARSLPRAMPELRLHHPPAIPAMTR